MGLGKPQSLCAAVAEHSSALEADLARFYPGTDLVDLWRGRLTWRKLAQYVQWLPKDAALYQSMLLARPANPAATPQTARVVVVDPLKAMQHGYREELLLQIVNWLEADFWRQSDPDQRGEFKPTLPSGYTQVGPGMSSDDDVVAYLAAMQPATNDQPEG